MAECSVPQSILLVRRAEGTDRCMEEEDLREWTRSDRYRGARLWIALNFDRRTLNWIRN